MAPIDVILIYAVFLSEGKKDQAAQLERETESFFGKGKLHELATGAVGLGGTFHETVRGVGVLPGIVYSRQALKDGIQVQQL